MRKILIIDDNDDYRDILKTMLSQENYHVLEATNGKEGLRILQTSPVDLILLDLVMTKMDGLEFYKQYKKKATKRIPIVILSNIVLSDVKKLIAQPDVIDYIVKADTTLSELQARVDRLLQAKSKDHLRKPS